MIRAFIDSSVLFAAAYSSRGHARDLLMASVHGAVDLCITELILEETRRNLSLDYPEKLESLEVVIKNTVLNIVEEPSKDEVIEAGAYVNIKDAPVVAGAKKAKVEFLVTYDRKHLLSPPEVAEKSGLQLVTPEFIVKLLSDHNKP